MPSDQARTDGSPTNQSSLGTLLPQNVNYFPEFRELTVLLVNDSLVIGNDQPMCLP